MAAKKAFSSISQPGKSRSHTANQRRGGVDFLGLGRQLLQIHFTQGIAFGQNSDLIRIVFPNCCHRIQIHRRSQNPALLMIRVIAADLCATGRGKIPGRHTAKGSFKACIQRFFFLRIQNKDR